MKYILPVLLLFASAFASAQTVSLYDTWSPAVAGSLLHITITPHEMIAHYPNEGLGIDLPQMANMTLPEDHRNAPAKIVSDPSIREKTDTLGILKVVFDSAKAKGRIFVRSEKGKGIILAFAFLLRNNGEAEIGLAPGAIDNVSLAENRTLPEVERATAPSAKRRRTANNGFGFGGFSLPFYNAARTTEFAGMKDPLEMPKEEMIGMINSFGDRMAAALQQIPQDTSPKSLIGELFSPIGPLLHNALHIIHELFITHGYNPLAAAALIEKMKDDSDIKAALAATDKKIEESDPDLLAARVRREQMNTNQIVSDTATIETNTEALPPPAPEETERSEFGGLESIPTPTQNLQQAVEYPVGAKTVGLEGTVEFKALIDANGRAETVRIIKGDHPVLNQAVIDVVMKTKFKPAVQNGIRVKAWYTHRITFSLH